MQLFDRFNLGLGFKKYFAVQAAINDDTRDEVFRIRHQVYCEELGYESVRPDRREVDEYDAHSLHCLLTTSQAPRQLVGCTRLVLARADDPDYLMPFEKLCAGTLDRSIVDPSRMARDRIAEVSRLAVRAPYRKRKGEQASPIQANLDDFGTTDRPRFPYILFGLYLGAIAMAARNHIDTIFVLTEPRLSTHFARLGVDIRQIGGPVEHRGTRIPSMMDVQSIIKGMRFMVKPLWRVIQEEIDESVMPGTPNRRPRATDPQHRPPPIDPAAHPA